MTKLNQHQHFICDSLGFSVTVFRPTELQAWLAFLGLRGVINLRVFLELVEQAKQTGFYCDHIDLSAAYARATEANA